MDIDTTLDWLTAIAVFSGLGSVFLLALARRSLGPRQDDEATRF